MTDEAKALVERLRWGAWYYEDPFDGKAYASDDPLEAADLIETQSREIERLRVECEFIASVTASPLINPLEVGFRHSPLTQRERETRYMEACAQAYQSARAALAGDSHDQ